MDAHFFSWKLLFGRLPRNRMHFFCLYFPTRTRYSFKEFIGCIPSHKYLPDAKAFTMLGTRLAKNFFSDSRKVERNSRCLYESSKTRGGGQHSSSPLFFLKTKQSRLSIPTFDFQRLIAYLFTKTTVLVEWCVLQFLVDNESNTVSTRYLY